MKKIKVISLCAAATLATLSLASCNKNDSNDSTSRLDEIVDTRGNLDIDMNEKSSNSNSLSSISADISNCKTHFYVGDNFNADGLVVKANYREFAGTDVISISKVVTDYYYSTDDVDLSKPGSYPVNITYREGALVKTTTYTVTVTNSEYDDYDVEYLAGIEPKEFVITISKGSTLNVTKSNFIKHYYKSAIEVSKSELTDEEFAKLNIAKNSVDTSKSGKYTMGYTYETSFIDKDGVNHSYTLSGFIIVVVE